MSQKVDVINSRLNPRAERDSPKKLEENKKSSFIGTNIGGTGFIVTPDERDILIRKDSLNGPHIKPYVGGSEVNTHPLQKHSRYVIDFKNLPLVNAEKFPDLVKILRNRVKPGRDAAKNHGPGLRGKKYWWQHTLRADPLYAALAKLDRCLVTARTTKHLCFSFQPTDRIFSESLIVFPCDSWSFFSLLQSLTHGLWVAEHSSSLGQTQAYRPSDCFENFPFPKPDPKTIIPELEEVGEWLYEARAEFMKSRNIGLTKTYNLLKDKSSTESEVEMLRDLHLKMDEAVLRAYGWSDIKVPPFTEPESEDEKQAYEAFKDEVIDGLYELNKERHESK